MSAISVILCAADQVPRIDTDAFQQLSVSLFFLSCHVFRFPEAHIEEAALRLADSERIRLLLVLELQVLPINGIVHRS